jgi:hypothetical protein
MGIAVEVAIIRIARDPRSALRGYVGEGRRKRMTARFGRTILQLLGLFALMMLPSTARAQGNTFNPYGNSGYADYREYGNPIYPTNPALPGQARLNSEPLITRPRANSYQQYTESLNASDSDAGSVRRASSNLPYYQAYQQLNSQYGRVYRPNDTPANRQFEDRLKQRDAAYAKALEERNPVKRMKLLREIEQGSADRTATKAAPRSTATPAAPRPNQTGTTSRAPSPYATTAPPAPGDRRTPSLLPYAGGAARRPSTAAPTTRPPSRPSNNAATTPTETPRTNETNRLAPDPSTIIPPPR